jgi:hypothetical protein
MHACRWRLYVAIIVVFGIAVASATPLFVYKCAWHYMPNLHIVRSFFSWFYITGGIVVYVMATLLILISFARRYGIENGSYIKTFLKLLYTHLFIFIPPMAYGISHIPYIVAYHTRDKNIRITNVVFQLENL